MYYINIIVCINRCRLCMNTHNLFKYYVLLKLARLCRKHKRANKPFTPQYFQCFKLLKIN